MYYRWRGKKNPRKNLFRSPSAMTSMPWYCGMARAVTATVERVRGILIGYEVEIKE
jgi:hypothetical protein